MKLITSLMALRPLCFFLCLALVITVLPSVTVQCWYNMIKRIELVIDSDSRIFRSEILSGINNTAAILAPIGSAAKNLATVLSSTDNRTSNIQAKVGPPLFQSLMLVPYASEVSYIGLNGVFYSVYFDGATDNILAAYNNCTVTCNSSNSNNSWYTQHVDQNGEVYEEAVRSEPLISLDDPRLIGADASLGYRRSGGRDLVLLNNAVCYGEDGNAIGSVSIGFRVKEVTDLLARVDFRGGSLYLTARDGNVVAEGTRNTRMRVANDSVSFESVNPNSNVSCQFRDWSITNIGGAMYDVYCSPIEIMGLQSVYALAMPSKGLRSEVQIKTRVSLILVVATIIAMVICILIFVFLMRRAARREMVLCSSLIKQMEATHEAERKSLSKINGFAMASHDVRASLAGIIGLIELCCDRVARGSEIEANLRQMGVCANDLLGLLNSILDTSKIEAGKMNLEEEEFDLAQLLEDVVDLFHAVGMKKGVDVVLDLCDGSVTKFPNVRGDRGKLKQILCNLVSNGVKFTREGHVSVRARVEKPGPGTTDRDQNGVVGRVSGFFVFEVEDTGVGIPREERESVFENYVQVMDSGLARGGTGLGLGIVRSLVRLMGGDITIVDKENDETGTCFRFKILLITTSEAFSTHNPKTKVSADGSSDGSSVLMMIQNDGRRRMLHKFMEMQMISVWLAENPDHLDSLLEKIKHKITISSNTKTTSSCFVMIIIDASAGPFTHLRKLVADFRTGLRTGSYRVVWLEKPNSRVGDEILDPNDVIISKPLHGTRLYQVMKIFPEFGGLLEEDGRFRSVGPLSGKRILIAEDTPFLRTVAMKMVTKLGATGEECENGEEAVDLVCNGLKYGKEDGDLKIVPYDYILMDCEMPEKNGYEATRQIREAEKRYGVRIPIIAVTAHTLEEETRKIFECGMNAYLCKPMKPQHLLEAISYIDNKVKM